MQNVGFLITWPISNSVKGHTHGTKECLHNLKGLVFINYTFLNFHISSWHIKTSIQKEDAFYNFTFTLLNGLSEPSSILGPTCRYLDQIRAI